MRIKDEVRLSKRTFCQSSSYYKLQELMQEAVDSVEDKRNMKRIIEYVEKAYEIWDKKYRGYVTNSFTIKWNESNNGDSSGAICLLHIEKDKSEEPYILIMRTV
jgi:hypothetical protein